MLNIVTVLRSGGIYVPEHVMTLSRLLNDVMRKPYHFQCFTDVEIKGIRTMPLREGWLGWWSKIEVFREPFADTTLFLDIDTLPLADLSFLDGYAGFAMVRDFFFPKKTNSGAMLWTGDHRDIFEAYRIHPVTDGGDGAYISTMRPDTDRLQDLWPGKFVSFKVDCRRDLRDRSIRRIPENVAMLCFHGRPKPWDCGGPIQKAWDACG